MSGRQQTDLQGRHEMEIEQTGNRAATQVAAREAKKTLKNPEFLGQIQDPDVDTDLFDWVEDEFGPVFSGAHILGDRGEYFEQQQEMLNRNKVERMVAERNPGRLLRENPRMLALAQGIRGTEQHPDPTKNPAFREPLTTKKQRVIRDAAEIATTRQTLGIEGRGLDAVANATVENRTVTNEDKEASAASTVKEVFR